jgi:Ca2+-binding RTX toxin-like protein
MSGVTYALNWNIEKLTLIGNSSINGTGNTMSNQITGNSGANLLNGGSGNDSLIGGAGNDSLIGGAGNDVLTGGTGSDRFIYDTNSAFINSNVGRDRITDFAHLSDKIVLDKNTFKALSSVMGNGFNVASEFAVVTSDAAATTLI